MWLIQVYRSAGCGMILIASVNTTKPHDLAPFHMTNVNTLGLQKHASAPEKWHLAEG